jgi:hypothetical protein
MPSEWASRRAASFIPQEPDSLSRRADENQTGLFDGLGKVRVFCEKAVAGMDRLALRSFGDLENFLYAQVACAGGGQAERKRLVGFADVPRVSVGIGVDGDRLEPQRAARPDDPTSDLPAIGNQNSHVLSVRRSSAPRNPCLAPRVQHNHHRLAHRGYGG